jgi:hypothetical protein
MYQHPSYAGRLGAPPARLAQAVPIIESLPDARFSALATADRACCCTAKPAVIVYLPAAEHGPETDLMLCMHHYRASRQHLAARGARVVDGTGQALADQDVW